MGKEVVIATWCSTALSCFTLLTCLMLGPIIYSQINDIWLELDSEISAFKVTSDSLWNEMMTMGGRNRRQAGYGMQPPESTIGYSAPFGRMGAPATGGQATYGGVPAGGVLHERPGVGGPFEGGEAAAGGAPHEGAEHRPGMVRPSGGRRPETSDLRPAGGQTWDEICEEWVRSGKGSRCKCSCARAKKCPAGKRGPKGPPGPSGSDGEPGKAGTPGTPGEDSHAQFMTLKGCIRCPTCGAGPTGPPGVEGVQGLTGSPGRPGAPGSDGVPGPPGERGPPGPQGPMGPAGRKGPEGLEAKVVVFAKGVKGDTGPIGPPGDKGPDGVDGKNGKAGDTGMRGPQGMPGARGYPGPAGPIGLTGIPGADSLYCPCPARSPPFAGGFESKPASQPSPYEEGKVPPHGYDIQPAPIGGAETPYAKKKKAKKA